MSFRAINFVFFGPNFIRETLLVFAFISHDFCYGNQKIIRLFDTKIFQNCP